MVISWIIEEPFGKNKVVTLGYKNKEYAAVSSNNGQQARSNIDNGITIQKIALQQDSLFVCLNGFLSVHQHIRGP